MFNFLKNFGVRTMGFLARQVQTVRLSPDDPVAAYLEDKIKPGENIILEVQTDDCFGEQFIISAGKIPNREVLTLTDNGEAGKAVYLILADASKNHVKVTLPRAFEYSGQLAIVCIDATHGIEIEPNPNSENVIFDVSNINFHAKGDSISLICNSDNPGTWFVVGRYVSQWYA